MVFKSIRRWWIGKIITLMSLYFLALVLALVVYGLGSRYWLGTLPGISVLNIIFHVLFLHEFAPYYVNSIIGVEWYLGALMIIYLLGPLFYKIINSLERAFVSFVLFCGQANDRNEAYGMYYCVWYALIFEMVIYVFISLYIYYLMEQIIGKCSDTVPTNILGALFGLTIVTTYCVGAIIENIYDKPLKKRIKQNKVSVK